MTDILLKLGESALARKAISAAGIPLPLPQQLERDDGPIVDACLTGRSVLCAPGCAADITTVINAAGAQRTANAMPDALVFDARAAVVIDDLEALHAFFHERIRGLKPNGRVLVIARDPASCADAEAAAVAAAVTGFIKSVAKEIGKKGATANAVYVATDADAWLPGALRFLLSRRSAYVDAQALYITATTEAATSTWERSLAGKVALVTGAARGIGEVTARRLAAEGATVLVLDVPSAADDTAALAKELGGGALTVDITAAQAVSAIRTAAKKHGGLDIVINNAGVTRDKTLANMDADKWRLALDVNLKAALRLTQAALKEFSKPGGRVVFLSSIAGIAGNVGQSNYGAAKAGLIGATRALAPGFAACGATINAVAPGFIETQMTAAIPFVTREAGRRLSALGQGGQPQDVAELITFLASPAAAGVNGQVVRVCGGNFLGA